MLFLDVSGYNELTSFLKEHTIQYRGSPTYAKITNAVPTTAVLGLCTCKWGIFAQVGDPLQSH